jgi:hypothetical protein
MGRSSRIGVGAADKIDAIKLALLWPLNVGLPISKNQSPSGMWNVSRLYHDELIKSCRDLVLFHI